MSFRIGITIGDVVERDGDLLGDGVNIAARLEGLAEVGGICVSRAVHEQVANKLSVQFADIGAQEVKNIPTPVHAYMVAMRREDGTYSTPQVKKKPAPRRNRTGCGRPRSRWSVSRRSALADFCISTRSRSPARPGSLRTQRRRPPRRQPPRCCSCGATACSADDSGTRAAGVTGAAITAANSTQRKVRGRDGAVRHRPAPSHAGKGLCTGRRLQGFGARHHRHQCVRHRSAKRRSREKLPPSNNARKKRMPRSRRASASFTRSATLSFIRTAVRRCRRCPGSSTTRPSRSRSQPRTCRWHATPEKPGWIAVTRRAERPRRSRLVPGGQFFFYTNQELRRGSGAHERLKGAALLPAFPAWSSLSTTSSSFRCRPR